MPLLRMLFLVLGATVLYGCALTLKAPDLPSDHPARPDAVDRPLPGTTGSDNQIAPVATPSQPDASSVGGHDAHKH